MNASEYLLFLASGNMASVILRTPCFHQDVSVTALEGSTWLRHWQGEPSGSWPMEHTGHHGDVPFTFRALWGFTAVTSHGRFSLPMRPHGHRHRTGFLSPGSHTPRSLDLEARPFLQAPSRSPLSGPPEPSVPPPAPAHPFPVYKVEGDASSSRLPSDTLSSLQPSLFYQSRGSQPWLHVRITWTFQQRHWSQVTTPDQVQIQIWRRRSQVCTFLGWWCLFVSWVNVTQVEGWKPLS